MHVGSGSTLDLRKKDIIEVSPHDFDTTGSFVACNTVVDSVPSDRLGWDPFMVFHVASGQELMRLWPYEFLGFLTMQQQMLVAHARCWKHEGPYTTEVWCLLQKAKLYTIKTHDLPASLVLNDRIAWAYTGWYCRPWRQSDQQVIQEGYVGFCNHAVSSGLALKVRGVRGQCAWSPDECCIATIALNKRAMAIWPYDIGSTEAPYCFCVLDLACP